MNSRVLFFFLTYMCDSECDDNGFARNLCQCQCVGEFSLFIGSLFRLILLVCCFLFSLIYFVSYVSFLYFFYFSSCKFIVFATDDAFCLVCWILLIFCLLRRENSTFKCAYKVKFQGLKEDKEDGFSTNSLRIEAIFCGN